LVTPLSDTQPPAGSITIALTVGQDPHLISMLDKQRQLRPPEVMLATVTAGDDLAAIRYGSAT